MEPSKGSWASENDRRDRRKGDLAEGSVFFGYEKISADEKSGRVYRHFETVAENYDIMNTVLSFGIHYLWKLEAVRRMGVNPGDRILDLCGGSGDLAVLAARKAGPRGRVVIYDINRAMLDLGARRMAGKPYGSGVSCVLGDAQRLSFPDNSFDAVMIGYGIRNLIHLEKGVEEMFRILRPGGRMMCLEFSRPVSPLFRWLYDFYSFAVMPRIGELLAGSAQAYLHLPESIRTFYLPDELADIFRDHGFADVRFKRQTNGISVVHTGRKP